MDLVVITVNAFHYLFVCCQNLLHDRLRTITYQSSKRAAQFLPGTAHLGGSSLPSSSSLSPSSLAVERIEIQISAHERR